MPVNSYLVLAAIIFTIGLAGVLMKRNALIVMMSVELMLNAANLDLVAFDVWLRDALHSGQAMTLFVITLAAAEIGLGLAIVLLVFRTRESIAVDRLDDLGETHDRDLRPGTPGAAAYSAVAVDHGRREDGGA